MSKAEELLNTLASSDGVTTLANMSAEPHFIVGNDRVITVPSELKRIAVQYDHDIETVTFDCPRYWDDHDMSEMNVYINYLRSDGETGCYKVQNVSTDSSDESIMHFDWTVSRNVTEASGKIVFLVCIKKADDDGNEKNHWNSELCKDCYVSEGLEYDIDPVKELYPDLIENWHQEVLQEINVVNDVKQELLDMRDAGEFNGATFTPKVSDAGDLSWTNDKGLANPNDVNIRGEPGLSPTITVTNIAGGYQLTITDVNGTKSINVMDTFIDKSDAVTKMFNDYIYIGDVEPTLSPILWFDTGKSVEGEIVVDMCSFGITEYVCTDGSITSSSDFLRTNYLTIPATGTIEYNVYVNVTWNPTAEGHATWSIFDADKTWIASSDDHSTLRPQLDTDYNDIYGRWYKNTLNVADLISSYPTAYYIVFCTYVTPTYKSIIDEHGEDVGWGTDEAYVTIAH